MGDKTKTEVMVLPEKQQQAAELVFALDIGTRSVIGIIGTGENQRFHVLDLEKREHERRAMQDGQIVDIDAVVEVAREVIRQLEQRRQICLRRVCVAAAGRALKSRRGEFVLELEKPRTIDGELVSQLEAGAVSVAQALLGEPEQERFYMVGYSVCQYRLDGYPLSTMIGHRGSRLEAEVLATFLPDAVVESLYTVVNRLGLEVASLTLEPIAALNVSIPEDIRLLNLALVDIGAGTSDIAVCQGGSVVGYTMATVAGDEITEHLMEQLLVDFQSAEQLKQKLQSQQTIAYMDVLGNYCEIEAQQLQELLLPATEALAAEIAARILAINGAAPSAIFLAGGGGKLWGLGEAVAQALSMSRTRVAIAGGHFGKSVYAEQQDINNPEYATPLGIGLCAALGRIHDSYTVLLNGARAKLFQSGTLSLRDVLLMNGYRYGDIVGHSGANLSVTLDGQRRFFPGKPPRPALLVCNGAAAELTDSVHAGDVIRFVPALAGENAVLTLGQLLGEDSSEVAIVNGNIQPRDYLLCTRDTVQRLRQDLAEGTAEQEVRSVQRPGQLRVRLNGKALVLEKAEQGPFYLMDALLVSGLDFGRMETAMDLLVNGQCQPFTHPLEQDDDIVLQART